MFDTDNYRRRKRRPRDQQMTSSHRSRDTNLRHDVNDDVKEERQNIERETDEQTQCGEPVTSSLDTKMAVGDMICGRYSNDDVTPVERLSRRAKQFTIEQLLGLTGS